MGGGYPSSSRPFSALPSRTLKETVFHIEGFPENFPGIGKKSADLAKQLTKEEIAALFSKLKSHTFSKSRVGHGSLGQLDPGSTTALPEDGHCGGHGGRTEGDKAAASVPSHLPDRRTRRSSALPTRCLQLGSHRGQPGAVRWKGGWGLSAPEIGLGAQPGDPCLPPAAGRGHGHKEEELGAGGPARYKAHREGVPATPTRCHGGDAGRGALH